MAKVKVNGKTIILKGSGNICINNGRIFIDGVEQDCKISKKLKVIIEGDCQNLQVDGSVEVKGSCKNIDCGGNVTIGGNVFGNIDAGGSVHCEQIQGNVDAGGNVLCDILSGGIIKR